MSTEPRLARRYRRIRGAVRDRFDPPPRGLVFWRPPDGRRNFGDELSAFVVKGMLARKGLGARSEPRKRLLAIGSILHFARTGDVVWGSGVNGKIPADGYGFDDLDVRAVRGPRTRRFLLERGIDCPEVFGDPALLLPRLLGPGGAPPGGKFEPYIVVPNLNDLPLFKGDAALVSPYSDIRTCIRRIRSARRVVASSLHGVVVAEALGVPAQLVLPEGHAEHPLKYQDYYEGTGRDLPQPFGSVEEALKADPPEPPVFEAVFLDRIEQAFPTDIHP